MTDSNWKPVPHHPLCNALGFNDNAEQVFQPKRICTCKEGTRWRGYGERVGDLAGVLAFAQGMAWLRGTTTSAVFALRTRGSLSHETSGTYTQYQSMILVDNIPIWVQNYPKQAGVNHMLLFWLSWGQHG